GARGVQAAPLAVRSPGAGNFAWRRRAELPAPEHAHDRVLGVRGAVVVDPGRQLSSPCRILSGWGPRHLPSRGCILGPPAAVSEGAQRATRWQRPRARSGEEGGPRFREDNWSRRWWGNRPGPLSSLRRTVRGRSSPPTPDACTNSVGYHSSLLAR